MTPPPPGSPSVPRDVVICGGGLAGLLLARQLRREQPEVGVTVLERIPRPLPDACHKVGESSVETGSLYLERLGLREHLLERQIVKLGLRFFPGGGHLPLAERLEIGPSAEPIVRSYQLDRGRFESDLRAMIEADGVDLIEGARVREVRLGKGGDLHTILYETQDEEHELQARWVVDATGRAALLRSEMRLKRGARHDASAGWFRITGRLDISDLVPAEEEAWHERSCGDERWRSTNHFMGPGYWAWVIPLATGNTSLGLVVHEETHPFSTVSSLDAVMAFLREHEPVLAGALDDAEVLDFRCLGRYSHGVSRSWSTDRWAIVGEAGAFVDPLYSSGTDFIAFANSFTTELIRIDREGGELDDKVRLYNGQYRAFVTSTTDLFRTAAPVYGHAQAMAAKIYWDNFTYWSYTCQYFAQELWKLERAEVEPFDQAGRALVELSTHVNALVRAWAELAPSKQSGRMLALPAFPSVLVDAHIAVGQRMQTDEALAYVRQRVDEGRAIVGELVLRAVQELGPDLAARLLERIDHARWGQEPTRERLEVEELSGRVRRRALAGIPRDVDRNLGPWERHPEAAAARALLTRGVTA